MERRLESQTTNGFEKGISMSEHIGEKAIVMGSGMAGLVSAIVLSEFFDQVLVLEKDSKPGAPGFRPGIPQGRHFHALIPGGLEIMEALLPGLKQQLREAGSILPGPTEFYFYQPKGKSYQQGRYDPNVPDLEDHKSAYIQTRGLLEFVVRSRVSEISNIEFRYDTIVKEPMIRSDFLAGVVDNKGHSFEANLTIDALGKTGRTMKWLDFMGYSKPEENVINCDFAYTSVFLKPNNPDDFIDVGFFVGTDPEEDEIRRGGALVRMEDGSWLALVSGRYGDYPPRDFEGFLDYAKTLKLSPFYELVSNTELIGAPAHFRFPSGVRRRFDQLEKFPDGIIPLGDSVCHFNPAYGQGMASACRQATALQRVLRSRMVAGDSLEGIWKEVLPEIYQETRAQWLFACMADFMHPECSGDFPQEESQAMEALQKLDRLSQAGDKAARELLVNIGGLHMPLSALEETSILN